jgi:hypothetical protein
MSNGESYKIVGMIPAKETYQALIRITNKIKDTSEGALYNFPVQGTAAQLTGTLTVWI